jgi:membrane-associated phospholipid phosphatase
MPHCAIELWVMSVLGSFGGVFELFDQAIFLLLTNDFLKGVPFAAALLLLWVVPRPPHADEDREAALYVVLATLLSLVIGRIVQNMFQSPRPLMVPEIAAMYPPTFSDYRFDWNSFPSDHMALYFAIALGVHRVRRALGMVLIGWSLVGVGFPRIYAGYHYPIDILGGMALGAVSLALVWQMRTWLRPLCTKVRQLAARYPTMAMSAAFILCFQIATVFNTARELGEFGRTSMRLLRTAFLQ